MLRIFITKLFITITFHLSFKKMVGQGVSFQTTWTRKLPCFVFMLLCALFNNPTVKGNRGLFIVTNITNLMVFRFVHKIIILIVYFCLWIVGIYDDTIALGWFDPWSAKEKSQGLSHKKSLICGCEGLTQSVLFSSQDVFLG